MIDLEVESDTERNTWSALEQICSPGPEVDYGPDRTESAQQAAVDPYTAAIPVDAPQVAE
jgi:hypothetical protein